MPADFKKILSSMGAANILKDLVSNKMLGIGVWNITQDKFTVVEEITGYNQLTYSSLPEFIEAIASPLDVEMVLMEFKKYIHHPQANYKSTFRLKSSEKEPNWVLLKGNKITAHSTGDEIFYVIILNVSGDNFEAGNDPKTNLVAEKFFIKKLAGALALKKPFEKSAIIRIGINNYKNIKDKYGLKIVRQLVKKVAVRLHTVFPEKIELARFSNDTYVGMLLNYKSKDEIQKLTDAIIEVFKKPIELENNRIQVRISLGVTSFPDQGNTVEEILLQAEYATQQSREKGNYITTFFNATLGEELFRDIIIENDMPHAIENKAFYVDFQPQVNIKTGKIIGIEALARWKHPHLGFISPEIFISMAEKQGLMPELGRSIMEQSLQTTKSWLEKGLDFGNLSINISPVELLHSKFLPNLLTICEKYSFPHEKLELEITEGIYLESIGKSDEILNKLQEHGFRIAVDDFGTGYSNLSFIAHSKLNTVKIDKSLIDDLEDYAGYVVMESIVDIARKLDYTVIAEGVETEDQVRLLRRINCIYIQGYYYSKPLPVGEMEALLEEKLFK